jgi:hypothetical protein
MKPNPNQLARFRELVISDPEIKWPKPARPMPR